MSGLAALAVRRPITTAMFFLAVSLLGVISWTRLPVQLYPELVFPQIFVSLRLQGASPEQIERELVMPVEEEIGKLEGLDSFEANARTNRGQVQVFYSPGTDMKYALLQIQSRLAKLQPLFPERTRVDIVEFDVADLSSTIMQINVLGEGDLNWLRDFTEEKIRPELESIDGIVNAQPLGGRRSAVEIIVDPFLLEAYGITMDRVRQRINSYNRRRQYLGRVYDGTQAFAVSIQGQFTDLQQMKQLVVVPAIPLKLEDIAEIRYGLQERTDLQRLNGKESVGIRIQKDAEANLIQVSEEIENTLERLNRELASESIQLIVNTSQAELMEEALDTLKQAAVVGGFLGLFVLFLFLRNLRFVTVLLLAIPASLLATFNLMYAWDLSLNVLSLCGLALAVGMLMDNGIVVMENIFKHFELGKSPRDAAREGAAEVSKAVVAATATTVMVFVPVVFIQSDAQDILRELALSMTFPLLASLLVALTLVPALCAQTLSASIRKPPESSKLMEMYILLLKASLRHRVRISVGIGLGLAVTLMVSFIFMLQQQVTQEETRFNVYASLPEGATLDATDEVVRQIEELIQDIEGIDQFSTSIQENQASITVTMKPLGERTDGQSVEEVKEKLDEDLQEIQGAVVSYDPISSTGGGGGGGRGGGGAAVGRAGRGGGTGGFNFGGGTPSEQAIIRGYDFEVLQTIADDLSFRLEELEELVNTNSVRADAQRSSPEVQVLPDPFNLFEYGLDVRSLLTAVEDASPEGFATTVPFMNPDGTEVNIDVRNTEDPEEDGPTFAEFKRIPVQTAAGAYVPIEELARIRKDDGRAMILRSNQTRRAIVSYQFVNEILDSQPLLDDAREVVQALIQDMVLPAGYTVEIVEAEEETIYYWMMGIAAILIYMILASLFESFSAPVIILCTLPTAVIGSCWALVLSGTGLTSSEGPMAILGFIVLLGIAVNNGIILIDAITTLRTKHGFRRERAVLAAGRSRVRPILMTSATTLLGVLPLALKFGGDFEVWPPFAITVLGGLTVSMLSTLIFIPVVYMGLDQVKAWLKDIGVVGIMLATLGAGAASYGIHLRYESMFWTSLVVLPFWFVFLGLFWAVIKVHRVRVEEAKRLAQAVEKIELRNLTKIYGAPSRFRREWDRFTRRTDRMLEAGVDPVDRKTIRDSLWWKLPFLALLVYLNTYFEQAFWIYVMALVTWALVDHLKGCADALFKAPAVLMRRGGFGLRYVLLPAMLLGYVYGNLDLSPVPEVQTEVVSSDSAQEAPAEVVEPQAQSATESDSLAAKKTGLAYELLGRHLERVKFGGNPIGYGAVVLFGFSLALFLLLPRWMQPEKLTWDLPLLGVFLGTIHWRLGLVSVTIASAVTWIVYQFVRFLSNRQRTRGVDLENMTGRLAWAKRLAYRGAGAVPLIGVPPPEFRALAGVDLEIERGMFGLLGPNGAGKTTLMRIVCQVLESSYGSVLVNGRNILQEGKLQGLIGYLPQHFGLYLHMSAFDFLDYRALLEGFKDGKRREKRVLECLDQVNLLDRKDDAIGSFSGGMKQRVGIAQTLLHMPQIVVVDEPTAGLDPLERIRFRNLLARVSQERIVIFSTHIVEDISGSCNKLAVLKEGKLLYSGTPQTMRDLTEGRVWEALIPEDRFMELEEDLDLITHVRNPGGVRARFLAGVPMSELQAEPVDPNLEDAYLFLLRHGEEAPC